MKKIIILMLYMLSVNLTCVLAQVSINSSGNNPDNSAILDVSSITKGLLIPRMTNTQIQYIANPANGLLVYCTNDDKTYCFHSGDNEWKELAIGTGTIIPDAVFTLGPNSTLTIANLYVGVPITYGYVHLWISGTVTAPGYWSITTSVINGYSFSGSGTFTSTGTVSFNLFASGTPIAAQTDYFSTSAGGGWSWSLTVDPAPFSCGDALIDTRDGQSYNTVEIGSQCWMAENLNIGVRIDGANHQTSNGTIEKYCFNDQDANCSTYGGMYQWDEMMQYSTTQGVQGICPSDWHVPSSTELGTLRNYLGGIFVAGGKIKETVTDHWNSPNTGATNESGFTGLPGGAVSPGYVFRDLGTDGYIWSSTLDGSVNAFGKGLYYDGPTFYTASLFRTTGVSVRCVKD